MKTYSVEELFDIDAENQEHVMVVKVADIRTLLNEVDTAFMMCVCCDNLTPQAKDCIIDTWPKIREVLASIKQAPSVFYVTSSNGSLTADANTGIVIECQMDEDGNGIDKIAKFDVNEWKTHYVQGNIAGMSIDILDLGDWDKEGKYTNPEANWRADFRNDSNIEEQIKQRKEALAKAFGAKLLEWIGEDKMREVITLNKGVDNSCCHSHDFCDANQALLDVFEEVGLDALEVELSNSVWGIAKANDFYFKPSEKVFFVRDLSGRGAMPIQHPEADVRKLWACTIAEEEEEREEDDEETLTYFIENAEVGESMALDGTEFERIR